MLRGISGYLFPDHTHFVERVGGAEAGLKNRTVSIVTRVTDYLFPSHEESSCPPQACALPFSNGSTDCFRTASGELLPMRDDFLWGDIPGSDDNERSITAADPTSLSVYQGSDFPCESGPEALPYLGSGITTDDCFPDQSPVIHHGSVSIAPKSLFDTASMVYVQREEEKLAISTIVITEGSDLARESGVSGKVVVENLFYEAGTGAIVAQVMGADKLYTFTLFSIELQSRFLPGESENEGSPVKNEQLQSQSQHAGVIEKYFTVVHLDKDTQAETPFLMKSSKQFRCHSDVQAVTNAKGDDIIEAVIIEMFQEEQRLASNPEPLKPVKWLNLLNLLDLFNSLNPFDASKPLKPLKPLRKLQPSEKLQPAIRKLRPFRRTKPPKTVRLASVCAAQLQALDERKKEWLATQRNASRLNIRFADNYEGGRYAQIERYPDKFPVLPP